MSSVIDRFIISNASQQSKQKNFRQVSSDVSATESESAASVKGQKLWRRVNTPRSRKVKSDKDSTSIASGVSQSSDAPLVRPTVTTLLRHHQIIAKKEEQEKKKVEDFVQGKASFDYENWKQAQQEEDRLKAMSDEAKKILKAKLAYHKAIAASKEVILSKSQQADALREHARNIRERLEEARKMEMERRRLLHQDIQSELAVSKRVAEQLQRQKRQGAQQWKAETEKLQGEAKQKEFQELCERKLRIQRIQAARLAMKAAKSQLGANQPGIVGVIGSPETEIKLKLAKECQFMELEERRKKVAERKKAREKKLEEVRDKLAGHAQQWPFQKQMKEVIQEISELRFPRSDKEIQELSKELELFQNPTRQTSSQSLL